MFDANKTELITGFLFILNCIYSSGATSQHTVMVEEQKEQTEGEDLEAQDGMLKMELQ